MKARARVGVILRERRDQVKCNCRMEGRRAREGVERNEDTLSVRMREADLKDTRESGDVEEGVGEESEAMGVVGKQNERLREDAFFLDPRGVIQFRHKRGVEGERVIQKDFGVGERTFLYYDLAREGVKIEDGSQSSEGRGRRVVGGLKQRVGCI